MSTLCFQALIKAADTDEATSIRRSHLFSLLEKLNEQIDELSRWLKQKAEAEKDKGKGKKGTGETPAPAPKKP